MGFYCQQNNPHLLSLISANDSFCTMYLYVIPECCLKILDSVVLKFYVNVIFTFEPVSLTLHLFTSTLGYCHWSLASRVCICVSSPDRFLCMPTQVKHSFLSCRLPLRSDWIPHCLGSRAGISAFLSMHVICVREGRRLLPWPSLPSLLSLC